MTKGPIEGRDIVIVSIQPWYYELGSNCKNIANQFSKRNRVLYVNIPITRKTYHTSQKSTGIEEHCRIIREKSENLIKVQENLWQLYPTHLIESINFIPYTPLFELLNRMNGKRFALDVLAGIKKLGFKDFILFNDNDIYNGYWLNKWLTPKLTVYYMRDFLQGYPFWRKHSRKIEPKIIRNADLVVANSTYYQEYASQFNPNSSYVGQGCNLELFDTEKTYSQPSELDIIPRPIIGYVGALDSERLNLEVIKKIAVAKMDWSVVLVGPQDDVFKDSDLHAQSNIYFLGRKDISQLPSFVKHFDICINPQKINPITTGNYPLKIDEYLAMGKPVVATRTEAMKLFSSHCHLANDASEYPQLIENALKTNSPEKENSRIQFARAHSWENSVSLIYEAFCSSL